MRIAVVANTSWYLYNFRLTLMVALSRAGHEVVAVGPPDVYVEKLTAGGIRHRSIHLVGGSINPFRELRTVWDLHRIFSDEAIDVVITYTPKGNIYSAIVAAMTGLPTVPNVSGLGRVFIHQTLLTSLVKKLYQFSFGRAARVFFQNMDDLELFVRLGLVDSGRAVRIPGSGVDLARFSPAGDLYGVSSTEVPGVTARSAASRDKFVFLLVARLLWDKGIGEYVEAARRIRRAHPEAEFRLLGFAGVQNPSAIPLCQVEEWVAEGLVSYLGSTDDVIPYLREADCVVLPSYREGVPRTLLEAAAMAKPLITTDAPGCRDAVDNGLTGFLCRLRDAEDLADKMMTMIEMDRHSVAAMGRLGREKMIREFDEEIVIARYLEVIAGFSEAGAERNS